MNATGNQFTEFHAELERVLSNEMFRNSESVRRLLAYLGERSLAGDQAGLKEFTIGVEAFNKPADYDPQQDPTVRVVASKLRHKLDDYYRTEGADNPVRLELPKGHYLLKFQTRPGGPGDARSEAAAQLRKWRRICWALAAVLVIALLLMAHWRVTLYQRHNEVARISQLWTPELELLWQPYLQSSRPILIVLGAPLFTKFAHGFFRDVKINQWEEAEQSERVRIVQKALGSSYASPWHNFTGIGEANGAFLLCRLLFPRTAGLSLKKSSALSWEDMGAHNVIFLGSPKFIPQLKDLPFEQDFVIEGGSLRNLRPRPGEPEMFHDVWTPSHGALLEDHAVVTRLPGLHGHGEITVLAATSTEGTWAATEYVTQPQHAKDLVSRLRLASGKIPESYQVVIRTKVREQVPIEMSYVTHRVLKPRTAAPAGR
jgi:hypothetical protein